MDVFNTTLINLRVLQSLQSHTRLDTTQTLFRVHAPASWIPVWLKRWWGSQTRLTDISRVQTLYDEATGYIEDNHPEIERLKTYLDESRRGLHQLKRTYSQDPTVTALLDVILDTVSQIVDEEWSSRQNSD